METISKSRNYTAFIHCYDRSVYDGIMYTKGRAVERGGSGGKLPRAPRQRMGCVVPQNEFFYRHLGWKQKLIIQILNFLNCATTFRRQSSSYSVTATALHTLVTYFIALLCTESEIAKTIDYDSIVDAFAAKYRKEALGTMSVTWQQSLSTVSIMTL